MLNSGEGIMRDDALAASWFLKAAEQGNGDAQFNIGLMCYTAEGVDKNDAEAWHWFQLAAEQGIGKAQFNLGVMLVNGEGGDPDMPKARRLQEAYKWWLAAMMQGDTSAQTNMSLLTEQLSAAERAVGEAAAVAWVNAFQARE
jgi:TPR repeat protein